VADPNDPFEFTRDAAFFRNGELYNREGYYLPGTSDFVIVADQAFSQRPYFDVSIANDGAIAQVIKGAFGVPAIADGTPDATQIDFDAAFPRVDTIVLDNSVVLREGDILTPISQFFGTLPDADASVIPLFDISSARAVNDTELIVVAEFSTNDNTFSPAFRAVFRVTQPGTPDQANTLLFTSEPGNPLPGTGGLELSTYATGEDNIDHNVEGDFLFTADIRGAGTSEDDALLRFDGDSGDFEVLLRAGEPSNIAGADWGVFINDPVALNDAGDWALLADTTADFASDALLLVNGQTVIREGATVGTAVPGPLQLGFANANIELDREGNVIWYAAWNNDGLCDGISGSGFGIFEGIFFNDQPLLEGGVTTIHDVTVGGTVFPELVLKDLPNTQFGGFYVSPDGDTLIVEALFAEPSDEICDFSINVDVPVASVLLKVDLARFRNGDAACPGDTDGNGAVDLDDLLAVLSNFGSAAGGLSDGDVDGSGAVDLEDLLIVLGNFGVVC
jgi:hypothetical protein